MIQSDEEDGFESDIDQEEELLSQIDCSEKNQILHNSQQFKLFNVSPIKQNKNYSLCPDIATGWIPKFKLSNPLPLSFWNDNYDELINIALENIKNQNKVKLCYLGPRYPSTYQAWYDKKFFNPYSHIQKPKNSIKFTTRKVLGSISYSKEQNIVEFDSRFQSGNLDAAFKVDQYEYELFMRVDSNSRGHLQWFNFQVKKMIKGKIYRFIICNFEKGKILYNDKMKPYVFSHKNYNIKQQGWVQKSEKISFRKKQSKACKKFQFQEQAQPFRLSFDYLCEYDQDQVQFAYSVPYTFTYLKKFLSKIQAQYQKLDILKLCVLNYSLGGIQIPIITVTNNIGNFLEVSRINKRVQKKMIIVSARTHPGQSNSSFMVQGFINFIVGNSNQASFLRDHIVFKIIPMLNPDGVILGNYRTGAFGKDLNRQFKNPDEQIFPEPFHLKKLVRQSNNLYKRDLFMFLDFHGHSIKKNVFMYGPQYPISSRYYYQCRIFPKLVSIKTQKFRYYSCSFKLSQQKQSTARGVLFKNYCIPLTYTIQASNGFYFDKEKQTYVSFNQETWIQVGSKICESLNDYLKTIIQTEKQSQEKYLLRKNKKKNQIIIKSSNNNFCLRKFKTSFVQQKKNIYKKASTQPNKNNEQIKTEYANLLISLQNQNQKQFILEHQISQGSSDFGDASNDITAEQTKFLIKHIKQKKIINQNFQNDRIKWIKKQNKTEKDQQIILYTQPCLTTQLKQSPIKRRNLQKKNSISLTSPTKEANQTAKIISFNFQIIAPNQSINKTHQQTEKNKCKNTVLKITSSFINKQENLKKKISNQALQFSSSHYLQRNCLSSQKQRKIISRKRTSSYLDLQIDAIKGRQINIKS